MKRISTRVKRRKNLGTTNRMHRYWKGNVKRKSRMKSFTTEEKARAWASEHKVAEKTHELRMLHEGKWQWRPRNARLEANK